MKIHLTLLLSFWGIFSTASCAGNNAQIAELRAELQFERERSAEARTELRDFFKRVEPLLLLAENMQEMFDAVESLDIEEDETLALPTTHIEAHLTREEVDAFIAGPMTRQARLVPSLKNGTLNGFKLYAIRPSSQYAKIGLMNGDTVHSINGIELNLDETTLEILSKLRDASKLEVSITRRGEPLVLTIHID